MLYLKRSIYILVLLIVSGNMAVGQNSDTWTLESAIQYALDHNISIQQNELNRRLEKLTLQQNRLAQLPNVNVSTGYGRSFGRSIDPTSNQFVEGSSYDFMSLSGNADVLLFGWFQRRNRIAQSKYNLKAAGNELEQLKNDVSLNVATGFLRILLAKEQVTINQHQVSLSEEQLKQTQKFADAGRLPELNVAQLESQLASDSANLIGAITEYNAAVLDMKALLNLSFSTPFEIELKNIDIEKNVSAALVGPEDIYVSAAKSLPILYSSEMRLNAAKKGYAAAKGALFPQLALNVQAGTNYSTLNKDVNVTGVEIQPVAGTYAFDSSSSNVYQVYQTNPVFTTNVLPLGTQLDNNFRQSVSLGLNIPLFNGWQAQTSVKQAKIDMLRREYDVRQSELNLRTDVYKAHNDARNSLQKYYAAERAAKAAKRAYEYAKKRNELGLTNTVEYLITQNNKYRAEADMASAKYDLIFKLKVIDFYLGKQLKL